jgi:GxxExxY protein
LTNLEPVSLFADMDDDKLCTMILAAAFRVHSRLGPGLLKSVYERVIAYELTKGGLSVEVQKSVPIVYGELLFDEGYRADLIVEKRILLELKSVEKLLPVHAKQVLTYIRLANLWLGYPPSPSLRRGRTSASSVESLLMNPRGPPSRCIRGLLNFAEAQLKTGIKRLIND